MPNIIPEFKVAMETLAPALIKLAMKVGNDDPDLVQASLAYDKLIGLLDVLQSGARK